jgi:hypothetical protein
VTLAERVGPALERRERERQARACRGCGHELDAHGYCTSAVWCTFTDRKQRGALPAGATLAEHRAARVARLGA